MENPPFEDVFPIQDGNFPLLCLFTGGYLKFMCQIRAATCTFWLESPSGGFKDSVLLLMEEIPNNHLGCIKPCTWWYKLPINWCRISSINRITPNVWGFMDPIWRCLHIFCRWVAKKTPNKHPGRWTAGTYNHHTMKSKENDLNQTSMVGHGPAVNLPGCSLSLAGWLAGWLWNFPEVEYSAWINGCFSFP